MNHRAVLGIDAAWTLTQPSGVALVARRGSRWHLIAVAASYQRFLAAAGSFDAEKVPSGAAPDATALLSAAWRLAGVPVDLVAVDMPLARSPIVGRRVSDNAVSRAYGGRKCGTHTPNALRPGPVSDTLLEGFADAGYPLQTGPLLPPGLIEVYPHPALVELTGAPERLPYKASKVRIYWPSCTAVERRARLHRQWSELVARLDAELVGVQAAMPPLDVTATGAEMKAYEDALDAIVCAWVGLCALEGRAVPFGDSNSAIWIPAPTAPSSVPRRTDPQPAMSTSI